MRLLILSLTIVLFFTQCKKYEDSAPFTDPRLTNPYCNDPAAINYNWGFPGKPDNSICIYPAEIFSGNYFYRDSFYNEKNTVHGKDSFDLVIAHSDSTHFTIVGFCNSLAIHAKANRFYLFDLDSLVSNGQVFCLTTDTIAGNGSKTGINDSLINLNYTVRTDTGIVFHSGIATKK